MAAVKQVQEQARSFNAEGMMDYWVGKNRVKGKIYIMGRVGARVRFNALNPTGDTPAADLTCNGRDFKYVDINNSCYLEGPCTKDSIAQLLRVRLEPDDFLLLAVGTAPIIVHEKGTIKWDGKKGQEIVELLAPDKRWRQQLVLERRDGLWDMRASTVWDADGKVEWKLQNKDFKKVTAKDGKVFRVPGKSRFEQPKEKADLIVKWSDRILNPEIEDSRFDFPIPAGIPVCK